MTEANDNWKAGDAYESYMGRWSKPLARSFVGWLTPMRGTTCSTLGAAQERSLPLQHFQDFWTPFLRGTGPAPAYVASLGIERRTDYVQHHPPSSCPPGYA